MYETKKIVCLANSRKPYGRCVAGKELGDGEYGRWIRPISRPPTGEIATNHVKHLKVLDVVTIPVKHSPHDHQRENYLVEKGCQWEKEKTLSWEDLPGLVDTVSGGLWMNGDNSQYGINDRISVRHAKKLKNSLLLIRPDSLKIRVDNEFYQAKKLNPKVRAIFNFNNDEYGLSVTDPVIEEPYLEREYGEYKIDASEIYMCISIGDEFGGNYYKLVAAVISKYESP